MQRADRHFLRTEQTAKRICAAPTGRAWASDKLALVIPTFREAANIRTLLDQVRVVLDATGIDYEILVVDDNSRDGIAEAVQGIAAQDARVRLLVREGERGLSGAIVHGWRACDAPLLGVMDADLQHPPALLSELLRAIEAGHDLVIGSRYVHGGRLDAWNPLRRMLSAVAVCVTQPLLRGSLQVKDPMSGFFLIRSRCIQRMDFQKSGFKLLLEILVRGRVRSVQEVPFAFARRRAGGSKASLRVACEYAVLLVRLYLARYGVSRWLRSIPAD